MFYTFPGDHYEDSYCLNGGLLSCCYHSAYDYALFYSVLKWIFHMSYYMLGCFDWTCGVQLVLMYIHGIKVFCILNLEYHMLILHLASRFILSFLPEVSFGLRVLSLPVSVGLCVHPSVSPSVRVCRKHLLVCTITHHPLKLRSPTWTICVKYLGLYPYCFLGWLTLTFKVKFNFKIKNHLILSLSTQ